MNKTRKAKFLKIILLSFVIVIASTGVFGGMEASYAAGSNVTMGMWYGTWYAKVPSINMEWRTNFGSDGANYFIGDVNGDEKDDAVVFKSGDGSWWVALSNGNGFNTPSQWTTGHGVGSGSQLLADCNGDGKKDAVVFFSSSGNWYVALSNGSGFAGYSQWISGHGTSSSKQLMADCNGDGIADAVAFFSSSGSWNVALSSGSGFNTPSQWKSGFGTNSYNQMAGDVNGDGNADAVYYLASGGSWYTANSSGSNFGNSYLWTDGHGTGSLNQILADGNGDGYTDAYVYFNSDVNGDAKAGDWYGRKNNKSGGCYGDEVMNSGFGYGSSNQFMGNVTGDSKGWKASVGFYASTGTWNVEPYHYFKYNIYNTWEAWNIKYLPWCLGSYQTYDSGNTSVIDEHLSWCAEAKVDFLLLDQTNNLYVDEGYIFDRAKTLASRSKVWNDNPSNRDVKYAVAIGGMQYSSNPATLEWEAGEVWDQFVDTIDGGTANYFYLNSKPILVCYCTPAQKSVWESWVGDKTNTNRFTLRWAHSPSTAGTYGWEVRNGTIDDDEAMVVMPGWNNNKGETPVSRSNGDYYALSCWDKVLIKSPKPQIVVINSFNEYAEETAVAPTDTNQVVSPTEQWYNKSGQIDNYMYWNMTKNYINLVQNGTYQASAGFSGGQGWYNWNYQQWNGSSYSNMTWDSTNNRWQGDQAYCLIMQDRQHPDTNDSVRKWVASYSGTVRITGTAGKETAGGDGVIVKILKNSSTIWGSYTITTTTGMSHDFTVNVSSGDSIYFIVNKNGNNSYDTTIWDPTITYQ